MPFLDVFDMYLIVWAIFNMYLIICSPYLAMVSLWRPPCVLLASFWRLCNVCNVLVIHLVCLGGSENIYGHNKLALVFVSTSVFCYWYQYSRSHDNTRGVTLRNLPQGVDSSCLDGWPRGWNRIEVPNAGAGKNVYTSRFWTRQPNFCNNHIYHCHESELLNLRFGCPGGVPNNFPHTRPTPV